MEFHLELQHKKLNISCAFGAMKLLPLILEEVSCFRCRIAILQGILRCFPFGISFFVAIRNSHFFRRVTRNTTIASVSALVATYCKQKRGPVFDHFWTLFEILYLKNEHFGFFLEFLHCRSFGTLVVWCSLGPTVQYCNIFFRK